MSDHPPTHDPAFRTAQPRRLLLIQPIYRNAYEGAKVASAGFMQPSLTLATLAAAAERAGHEVAICDLDLLFGTSADLMKTALDAVADFRPEALGITFNTCTFDFARELTQRVKSDRPETFCIGGGVHISSFPSETLEQTQLDLVVSGEGDFAIVDILERLGESDWRGVPNVGWRDADGKAVVNDQAPPLMDLDRLAMPSWRHFDLKRYRSNRLAAKANPVGSIETSRGCVYECVYCNKNIFGNRFRVKSPERVVDEMAYMLESGFGEISVMDDCFTTQPERAKEICRMLIDRRMNAIWSPRNGLRVDKVDLELLELMKASGCYRVIYGIESGNQQVLDRIRKKSSVQQIRRAVSQAKEAGLETVGYFMMGLPGEDEAALEDTIRLAIDSGLDLAKVSLTLPLPGTALYKELLEAGRLEDLSWSDFNFYQTPKEIYAHDTLDWERIEAYEKRFYREFYLRPSFIWNRLKRGLATGEIFSDAAAFLKTRWA